MKPFIHDDFLLETKTARELYHGTAKDLPIIDYHCHLPPADVAKDRRFENLTQIWLYGDHYKWRAMRAAGVPERYCTGDASDWEKYQKWAETVPKTLRNPLYHWTHLELNRPFGVSDRLLGPGTAKDIWDRCNAILGENGSPKKRTKPSNHLFTGVTYCHCGKRMYVKGCWPGNSPLPAGLGRCNCCGRCAPRQR